MSKKKKNVQSADDKRTAKKAEVLGNQASKKRGVMPIILVAIVLVAAAGFMFWCTTKGPNTTASAPDSGRKVEVRGDQVFHDMASFNDGKAQYFSIQTRSGVKVKYFLLKSSDGVIRAAFDACDVCWRAGLGYVQEGDDMVCRNCGLRFPSVRINEVKGGCNPAPLQRREEGGRVVINMRDIEAGAEYFNLPM